MMRVSITDMETLSFFLMAVLNEVQFHGKEQRTSINRNV